MMWAVAEKTGWPLKKIIDMPFLMLNIMMSDAPRLRRQKKNEVNKLETAEDLKAFFGKK